MNDQNLESVVRDYLEAYASRDLPRCLAFFAPDAKMDFAAGVYEGHEAIEGWHKDRWNADAQVLRIERINAKGDKVIVDLVVTSKVVKQWRFNSLSGRATLTFDNNQVKDAQFSLRVALPFEGW